MANRCFAGPTRAVTTASDSTSRKKNMAIYNELQHQASKNPPVRPRRTPGGFTISPCAHGRGVRLTSASSYDLLDSAIRGKAFSNPVLMGAGPRALDQAWGAGLQEQTYDPSSAPSTGFSGLPTDCSDIKCPWTAGLSGPMIDEYGLYSRECTPGPGAYRVSPWQAHATAGFKNSDAYWAAVNAQPLQGSQFRSAIQLVRQTATGSFVPTCPVKGADAAGVRYCRGKGAIN